MSYPISGQNPSKYTHPGYAVPHPIIPHGVSVAVTAPAVVSPPHPPLSPPHTPHTH